MVDSAIKFIGSTQTKIAGYALVFGGADLVGDFFDESTDLWQDRLSPNPPILWNHGHDESVGKTAVGRVTSSRQDNVGLWVEGVLDSSSKYLEAIRDLVNRGILGFSTGAVAHLVERVAAGSRQKITSWPIAELSLTPTPAEPRTLGVTQLKALAASEPWLKAALTKDVRDELWGGISEVGGKSAGADAVAAARQWLADEHESERREVLAAFVPAETELWLADLDPASRAAREGEIIQRENALAALRQRAFG